MKTYRGLISKLEPNQIIIFGSNTEGIHGAGAAKWALDNAGAIYGQNKGLQGQSYAIITKDLTKKKHPSITVAYILLQLATLVEYTEQNSEKEFLIAYSGDGYNLNGYTPEQMANMFSVVNWPENVIFEEKFYELMKKYERRKNS